MEKKGILKMKRKRKKQKRPQTAPEVQREYCDRLLNYIFGREENKAWTLSLFNAVNGSHYDDPSLIEFNTLKDVLYMGMRNDTSFLISDMMSVYEHQSTYNPNMPLRMLGYVDDLYSGYVTSHHYNKYGSSLIKLPIPKLVVFYNGGKDTEDETELMLGDSFDETRRKEADVEVRVRMLNINLGHNEELMHACKPLAEYAWFINEIRTVKKTNLETNMTDAVNAALEAMPADFGIHQFLMTNRAEVIGMLDREYNEDNIRELFMEDGRREERANTERERERADSERERADKAEARIKELEAQLAASLSDQ